MPQNSNSSKKLEKFVNFWSTSLVQLIFRHNCWLDSLIEGLARTFSIFSGVLNFKKMDLVPCIRIMWVRDCQNAMNIAQSLYSNMFLQDYRLDFFHEDRNWNVSTIWVVWVWKLSFPFQHWKSDGPKIFVRWAYLDFQTRIPPFLLTDFFFQGFNLLVLEHSKIIHFLTWRRISTDQNCQKVLLVLTCPDIQTFIFFQLYMLHFSIKASIDSLLLEAGYSFRTILKFFSHENWNQDWPKVLLV